jgi:hypothetical protein
MFVEFCLINPKAKKNTCNYGICGGVSKIQTMFGVVVMSQVFLGGTLDVICMTYMHHTTIFWGC